MRRKNGVYAVGRLNRERKRWISCAERMPKKISAYYHPVGEETFALLKDILKGACFEQIGKVVIHLKDDSVLTISTKGVRRVAKVDLELER